MRVRQLSIKCILCMISLIAIMMIMSITAFAEEEHTNGSVYVGGVHLTSGQYVVNGSAEAVTGQPSDEADGYAYYENGVLTLNGYFYEGEGYVYTFSNGEKNSMIVYADSALTVNVVGENHLKNTGTYDYNDGIAQCGVAPLTITGDGTLNVEASTYCIYLRDDAVVWECANATLKGGTGILCDYGNLIIRSGNLAIEAAGDGISLYGNGKDHPEKGNLTINGGTINIQAEDDGIDAFFSGDNCGGDITINGGTLTITAKDTGMTGNRLTVNDGTLNVISDADATAMYGGVDSTYGYVALNGGNVTLTSQTGDGINVVSKGAIADGDAFTTPNVVLGKAITNITAGEDGIDAYDEENNCGCDVLCDGEVSINGIHISATKIGIAADNLTVKTPAYIAGETTAIDIHGTTNIGSTLSGYTSKDGSLNPEYEGTLSDGKLLDKKEKISKIAFFDHTHTLYIYKDYNDSVEYYDLSQDIDMLDEAGYKWDATEQTLIINETFNRGISFTGHLNLRVQGEVNISANTVANGGIIVGTEGVTISPVGDSAKLNINFASHGTTAAVFAGVRSQKETDTAFVHINPGMTVNATVICKRDSDLLKAPKSLDGVIYAANGTVTVDEAVLNVVVESCYNMAGITGDVVAENGAIVNVTATMNPVADNSVKVDRITMAVTGKVTARDTSQVTLTAANRVLVDAIPEGITFDTSAAKAIDASGSAKVIAHVETLKGYYTCADNVLVEDSAKVIYNGFDLGTKAQSFFTTLDEYLEVELAPLQMAGMINNDEGLHVTIKMKDGVDPQKYGIPAHVVMKATSEWGDEEYTYGMDESLYTYNRKTGELNYRPAEDPHPGPISIVAVAKNVEAYANATADIPYKLKLQCQGQNYSSVSFDFVDLSRDIDGGKDGYYWDTETRTLTINENFIYEDIWADGTLNLAIDGKVTIEELATYNRGVVSASGDIIIASAEGSEDAELTVYWNYWAGSIGGNIYTLYAGYFNAGNYTEDTGKLIVKDGITVNLIGYGVENGAATYDSVRNGVKASGGIEVYGVLNVSVEDYKNVQVIETPDIYVADGAELNITGISHKASDPEALQNRTVTGTNAVLRAEGTARVVFDLKNEYQDVISYAESITYPCTATVLLNGKAADGASHSYSTQWKADDKMHWHECACGLEADKEAHSYKNGTCTVCKAVDSDYTPEKVSPKTGDINRQWIWIVLLALGGSAVMIKRHKKTI